MIDRETIDHILTVGGQPLLAQLVEMLKESVPQRLAAIDAAVAVGNAETILQQAHALRSGAGNLGATHLTTVAATMEMRARAGDLAGMDQMAAALRQRYDEARVDLERLVCELETAPAASPGTPPAEPAPARRVLALVEDNVDNQVLTRAILQGTYDMVIYSDGPSALTAIRARPPALVLLDISLPGMDGEEVLGRLRADPATRNLPIMAVTAHAMKGDRERFLAAGFDDYLAKPIDEAALLATVARLLERRR